MAFFVGGQLVLAAALVPRGRRDTSEDQVAEWQNHIEENAACFRTSVPALIIESE
jgi:hypothetical protein